MASLKEHIQQKVDFYKQVGQPISPFDIMLLDHAVTAIGTGNKGGKYMKIKQCFCNALNYAIQHKLRYAEGLVYRHVPIEHAWVVDNDGGIIDPTLRNSKGVEYLGVSMEPQQAWDIIFARERHYYGVFFNDIGSININAIETLYPEYKGRDWWAKP